MTAAQGREVEDRLRWWGFWFLIGLIVVLSLIDAVDDIFLGGRYMIPKELWAITSGAFAALFGRTAIDAIRRRQ